MIDVVRLSSSSVVRVFACMVQLSPFHALSGVSPVIPLISPSSDDPSPLQIGIGCAMTIHFPHDTRGEAPGGGNQPSILGVPIQIATHIPRVRVGVTNIRILLEYGAHSQKIHHAPIGDPGHIKGMGHQGVGSVVGAEKTGSQAYGVSGPSGIPKSDGALPGASGAQFTGKLIHDPHPNPHCSPSERFCAIVDISLTDSSESPISRIFPHIIFACTRFDVSELRLVPSHISSIHD